MSETLTFENTQEVTSVDNLNADEQDSLQVGAEMQKAQDTQLAGKYKDAQELEKAYIELEKKLGEKSEPDSTEQKTEIETKEEKSDEESGEPPEYGILDDLWSQATSEKGEYTKETLDKLGKMSTRDLAQLHLEWRQDAANKYIEKPADFTEKDVTELKNVVGGADNYNNMLQWAQSNLTEQEQGMFDAVMERGDSLSAFFAVKALSYRYQDEQGYQGKMLTGNAPKSSGQQFRSQAEVVQAMQDPRYENDPAYRSDVMEKLSRSNVKF